MLCYFCSILWPIAGGWGVFDLVGEIIPGIVHLHLWGRIISQQNKTITCSSTSSKDDIPKMVLPFYTKLDMIVNDG